MRKKVVREEPFGKSGAIKVIYEDGTYGIRGVSSKEPDQPSQASPYTDNLKSALIKETLKQLDAAESSNVPQQLRAFQERYFPDDMLRDQISQPGFDPVEASKAWHASDKYPNFQTTPAAYLRQFGQYNDNEEIDNDILDRTADSPDYYDYLRDYIKSVQSQ